MAAIEFALVAPLIILMMLAGTDLTIFMRTKMRIDETATETALVVTQYQDLYNGDFTALFNAAQTVAGTTKVTGLFGTTIITGIVTDGNDRQTIAWQKRSPRPRPTACLAPRSEAFQPCRTTISCRKTAL